MPKKPAAKKAKAPAKGASSKPGSAKSKDAKGAKSKSKTKKGKKAPEEFVPVDQQEELPMTIEDMANLYGGCEGPNAKFVKLISSDEHEFLIRREFALNSDTIKAMLRGPGQFDEKEINEMTFSDIPSHLLHKMCTYFNYKECFTNCPTEIPELPLLKEMALELLRAANTLDC